MNRIDRAPWTSPRHTTLERLDPHHVIAVTTGAPWSHVVEICQYMECDTAVEASRFDIETQRFTDGPLAGRSLEDVHAGSEPKLPLVLDRESLEVVCDDPMAICHALAPDLFDDETPVRVHAVRSRLIDHVYRMGEETDQARYEDMHLQYEDSLIDFEYTLGQKRFLVGDDFGLSDVLLYAFSVRLDAVYYELYKASVGLLADFESLQGHTRDLYERAPFYATTDFDEIKRYHYLVEPVLNSRGIVPEGGIPDLDAPHFRAAQFGTDGGTAGVEEDQEKDRVDGEWVRPHSEERHWIRPDDDAEYPAEAGRYHLYAPYNCPWSHRALLGRAVKGLEDVIGASIVYFRRDPERGWQFNPRIPGCTEDRANGVDYIEQLYERVGSDERSVPLLWDTVTETIVSNESADIMRMFGVAFDELAARDIELYPREAASEIDRINEAVYQRINNGAYKAGFADSQAAYERAFARYFRALDWLEDLLGDRTWLAGTDHATEADLRLFPTVFRHDAVYYTRFKLNQRRIADYPRLSNWLDRMMEVPGVADASNLDHARNGYFGRTGNEVVPAGPVPLGLSAKDFSRDVWLNQPREG